MGRFQYGKLAKYPHLSREDIITWEQYIEKYPEKYERVDYDFALGKIEEHTTSAIELGIAGAERVNQYRIDVIGYKNNEIDIIEVKNKATPAVLGHIKAEKFLYDRDHGAGSKTKMIIIAREMTPELDTLAKAENIQLILV